MRHKLLKALHKVDWFYFVQRLQQLERPLHVNTPSPATLALRDKLLKKLHRVTPRLSKTIFRATCTAMALRDKLLEKFQRVILA